MKPIEGNRKRLVQVSGREAHAIEIARDVLLGKRVPLRSQRAASRRLGEVSGRYRTVDRMESSATKPKKAPAKKGAKGKKPKKRARS